MSGYQSVRAAYAAYRDVLLDHICSFLKSTDENFEPFRQSGEALPRRLAHISEEEACSGYIPIGFLQQRLGFSNAFKAAAMCAYFSAVDGEFGYACSQVTHGNRFLDANDMIGLFFHGLAEFFDGKDCIPLLFQFDSRDAAQYNMPLLLHSRIFAILCGEETAYRYPYFTGSSGGRHSVEMTGRQAQKDRLLFLMKNHARHDESVAAVVGERGSGRKLLLETACRELGMELIVIDWHLLKAQEPVQAALDVRRELLLQNAYCCVTDLNGEADRDSLEQLWLFASLLSRSGRPLFVTATEDEADLLCSVCRLQTVRVGELSRQERCRLWQRHLPGLGEACGELADAYRFTPGQIQALATSCKEAGTVTLEEVKRRCVASLSDIMGNKAQLIRTGFTFDDLILPESEKQQLAEALNHIRFGSKVYDLWNFKEKYPYGRGLILLFEGAPGTGKTMAASVISAELGVPAFKVDLSKVVSKYIGETEKKLGEIFDIAQRNNAVLFFDETDALFGRRSEIRDSHDRYANIETSYLLQRIEEFHGVAILATNFMKNMDDAFLRRIHYVIHFPYPGCDQRLALWKSCFPENTGEKLDFSYLAEHFELSGAMIKNTVLSAAFLAAAEEAGSGIAMGHVVKALKTQMKKHGRVISDGELETALAQE